MTDIYNRPAGQNRFQIASASERPLFSAWLDQEYNAIYRLLNGLNTSDVLSVSEWAKVNGSFTQDNSTSFTVEGDLTGVFEPLRAIRIIDDNESEWFSHIQSSSYSIDTDLTTVTLYDAIVPATINQIAVGLVSNDSAAIPSVNVSSISSNYTIGALDKVILADDTLPSSYTIVYDDGQVGGAGYPALLITLPVASSLPNKLLCVKKIAGTHRTIVSSNFVHSTSLNSDNETVHTNTYDFQVLGESIAKNRVELKGIGDCYWFVSNGTNWYELTPEASETVKGIIRCATSEEMTLTAQQIADGEELSKNTAVSPFHADKEYMRTDASNMRFASNYIYTAPNGVPAFINGNIEIYEGLGLNIPTGRDEKNVCTSKKFELSTNHSINDAEVSEKKHLLFVDTSSTFYQILAHNYYIGYDAPVVTDTQVGDNIIWFDYSENKLKRSTDNGTNWTTFDGAGPICSFSGNGSSITSFQAYAPLAFLTRDDLKSIRRKEVNWDAAVSIAKSQLPYTFKQDGWYLAGSGTTPGTGSLLLNSLVIGTCFSYGIDWAFGFNIFVKIKQGDVLSYTGDPALFESHFLPEMN